VDALKPGTGTDKAMHDRLQLARELDKLLKSHHDIGVDWRRAPTNVGML